MTMTMLMSGLVGSRRHSRKDEASIQAIDNDQADGQSSRRSDRWERTRCGSFVGHRGKQYLSMLGIPESFAMYRRWLYILRIYISLNIVMACGVLYARSSFARRRGPGTPSVGPRHRPGGKYMIVIFIRKGHGAWPGAWHGDERTANGLANDGGRAGDGDER